MDTVSLVGSEGVAVGVAGAGGIVSRPRLFARLTVPARVSVVFAGPGSGKTVLLRSWIGEAPLAGRAAWVPVEQGGRDPQQFWLSVLGALRETAAGSRLVRELAAAPDLDGWVIVERLLEDLAPLDDQLWLVVDDAHELGPDALRQLELLIMRASPELRFVLATRHDVRLRLHRLRLEGGLAEIREADLHFTVSEARELLAAAGVQLRDPAPLVERTEGWAAGLRLAALSLAGQPDPERLAAEFSGRERTVAEYLLAEVLDRQGEPARRLLLRTSILERINGELAGLLTGERAGERVLQDMEAANAFVVALDTARSWFRYHHLFADLLQLELRRTEPDEIAGLHRAAAGWFAGHGYPVEAVRHAQAAQDWGLAAQLLADHWPSLHLEGQDATIHELVGAFPAEARAADAELAAVAAADQLAQGSLEAAERYLNLAERASVSAPGARRGQLRLLRGVVSLLLAGQRANLEHVARKAQQLAAAAEDGDALPHGLTEDLRAVALISLGSAEFWAAGEDAGQHLQAGLTLARRIHRPYLEFTGLAYQSVPYFYESFKRCIETAKAAVELARLNGWSNDPAFGVACMLVGGVLVFRGQLDEAEPWVQDAERTLRAETHPVFALSIRTLRGDFELARGQHSEALNFFQAAERVADEFVAPLHTLRGTQALIVHALVGLGETDRAEQVLARLTEQERNHAEIRIAAAALRLANDDAHAALAELGPVLEPTVRAYWRVWLPLAYLLEAIAREALRQQAAVDTALERALDVVEPDGNVMPFLMYPSADLLERHARHGTAHAALVADILSLLAGRKLAAPPAGPLPPLEPLTESELRVLRYLPTNLSAPEIARELYVSHNTVRTHLRHLYAKLGTHRRTDTIAHARALGLLAPSPYRGQSPGAG